MNAEWPTARLQMEGQPRPPGYRHRSAHNQESPLQVLIGVCSVATLLMVGALVFRDAFRRDVLAHDGEATILGILSVKGVAFVLILALLLGTTAWAIAASAKHEIDSLKTLVASYETKMARSKSTVDAIGDTLSKAATSLQTAEGQTDGAVANTSDAQGCVKAAAAARSSIKSTRELFSEVRSTLSTVSETLSK